MAIVHHVRGDDRSEIKNYPEIENEDGVLTYNVTGKDHLSVMTQERIEEPKDHLIINSYP